MEEWNSILETLKLPHWNMKCLIHAVQSWWILKVVAALEGSPVFLPLFLCWCVQYNICTFYLTLGMFLHVIQHKTDNAWQDLFLQIVGYTSKRKWEKIKFAIDPSRLKTILSLMTLWSECFMFVLKKKNYVCRYYSEKKIKTIKTTTKPQLFSTFSHHKYQNVLLWWWQITVHHWHK